MLSGLENKVVLVSGAGGGIGRAVCERLLCEGAFIVAADLDTSSLSGDESGRLRRVDVDLRREEGVASFVESAIESYGGLDLAFLGAGVECSAATVAAFSEAEYERVFDINVRGMFLCCQAIVGHLLAKQRCGGILLVSSIAGLRGHALTSIYNASKHAVVGLGRCLSQEVGSHNIRVNVLCPGMVDTRMAHSLEQSIGAASGSDAARMRAALEGSSPLGRYATAQEVAAMGVWILSDEASFAHGEIFTIGGGIMA